MPSPAELAVALLVRAIMAWMVLAAMFYLWLWADSWGEG